MTLKVDKFFRIFSYLPRKPIVQFGMLLSLLFAGFVIRVHDFDTFQAGDRQYRSAIIARALYFKDNESIPKWSRQVAEISRQRSGILEPPIMEMVVSWVYRLVNGVHLSIPRILSSLFWTIGGFFLYKITMRFFDFFSTLLATAYYLFVPMGIFISTGFVPDPLMIMVFLLSILLIVQYFDSPSKLRLIIAGLISALAILVKPFSLFTIVGVFIALAISKKAIQNRIIKFDLLIFIGIILLPVIFYIYGIYSGGLLLRQAQSSFLPNLLLTRSYWQDWLSNASRVVGFAALLGALIGLSIVKKGTFGALLIGLWSGYVGFCLIFTYHIRFSPHYHSQLIIIVALSLGSLIALISDQFRQLSNKWFRWMPVTAALILVMVVNLYEVRDQFNVAPILEGEAISQQIGEIVNHSTKTIYLAYQYGTPLEYYGELSGSYWPRGISNSDQARGVTHVRSIEERLDALDFIPEFFIVTNFREYNTHHADLKEYLEQNCSELAERDEYLIYSNCKK